MKKLTFRILISSTIWIFTLALAIGFYVLNRELKGYNNKYLANNIEISSRLYYFQTILDLPYRYINRKIDNVKLLSIENDTFLLQNIVNKRKLIFYYNSQKACNVCVDQTLLQLKKLAKKVSSNCICVLTNIQNIRDLKILSRNFDYCLPCYKVSSSVLMSESELNPDDQLMVIIGEDLKILYYIPISSKTGLNDIHLNFFRDFLNVVN